MRVLLWKARCRILSDPQSLKEKRSVVKSLLAKVCQKFPLSAAEVGQQDMLNTAEFGFCSVGTDSAKLEQLAENCRAYMEREYPVEFFSEDISVEAF